MPQTCSRGDTPITTYRVLAILIVCVLALATVLHLVRTKRQPTHISSWDLENDFNVSVAPGDGWWEEEHGEGQAWRWSGKNGRHTDVIIETATSRSEVTIKASYGALRSGNSISVTVNGSPVAVQTTETSLVSQPIRLDRTRNVLRFTEALDPEPAKQPDSRMLGVLWKKISIESGDGQRDPNSNFDSVHYGFEGAVDASPIRQ
jgi:hypothetical protein